MIDEQREIIETIRDRRDRAVDAHGRTAAAMDAMHLSPFEQAVYVDAALNNIDRLTEERDAACKNEARWRERINAIIAIAESYESSAQDPELETNVARERIDFAQCVYAALGIESEADHD